MKFSAITRKDTDSFISSRERSWEEHVAAMLDPERLKFRLRFLTEVTLPQFAGQNLKPRREWFRLIVVTTTLLPDDIRSALNAAAGQYPWLTIVERGVDDWLGMSALTREALSDMDYGGTRVPFMTFRLDDDDTLSLQYLERAQGYIGLSNIDRVLSFTQGAKILWHSRDFLIRNYQEERRPFIAIGLAAIGAFDFEARKFASELETVFVRLNHYKIKDELPTIEDETPRMFIWSHHVFQDTFGRFKSVEFPGEWTEAPADITGKLEQFPSLTRFIGR
jgi:hypothetical protein